MKRRRITPTQTHIRVFKTDRELLLKYMRRRGIRSQALAFRLLIRRR